MKWFPAMLIPTLPSRPQIRRRLQRRRGAKDRSGFTFIEAMTAVTIASVVGLAILTGVNASLQNTTAALDETIGLGMAQQLMDEIAGQGYARIPASPYDSPLAPDTAELLGPGRSQFTNLADYNNLSELPPLDFWGVPLGNDDGQGAMRNPSMQIGTYFANWQRTATVYYVSATNLSTELPAGQTSNYRAVEVHVSVQDKAGVLHPVASLRQVFAYVPSS
jgi:type II secretory pathway pseudopilin PulG